MKITRKISIPVYDCTLQFSVTDEIMKDYGRLAKKYKLNTFEDLDGVFIHTDCGKYFILINARKLTHNTLSHEIYHAATGICAHRCIEDEESRAWVDGFLTAEIYKFLDRKKQTIKHE
jgi:hypothetical protein